MSLRIRVLLLSVLLAGCAVKQDLSPLPEPAQPTTLYFPVVFNNYPSKPVGVSGGIYDLDADWYYHWSISPYANDPRFVPMVWCPTPTLLAVQQYAIIERAKRHPGDVWLIGNEPDGNSEQCAGRLLESGETVRAAPREYAQSVIAVSDLIRMHDVTAEILVGGIIQIGTVEGRFWWTEFVDELQLHNYEFDGVHIHAYPCWSTTCTGWGMDELFTVLNEWHRDYFIGLGLSGPVWISEIGAGPHCSLYSAFDQQGWLDVRDNVMEPFQEYMTTSPYVTTAWFVSWDGLNSAWTCNYLIDLRDELVLTPLGESWQ